MPSVTFREYHLIRRPVGMPTPADFAVVSQTIPALGPDQLRIRNSFLSVDPYMRGRMADVKSYAPSFKLDAAMEGGAVGLVEESNHRDYRAGDLVFSMQGWREGFISDGTGLRKLDPSVAPPQAYLGTLGMPGLTAYVGLLEIGRLVDGETVLVSGAAGAVGMVVCQIAKAKGCRVIGVVGSAAKAEWLRTHTGIDTTINYRETPNLRKAIAAAAPDGVDLTFENVGGDQLEAALANSKDFARLVLCGLISGYNATEAGPGIRNLIEVVKRRLTVRGFIVSDHNDKRADFARDMTSWIKAGQITWTETVVPGFDRMLEAFLGLFSGSNLGKMVIQVD